MTAIINDLDEPRVSTEAVPALIPPPWSPECWSDAEQSKLVCRKVLDITHDVKSFLFEAPEGRVFRFDPGQFVTLHSTSMAGGSAAATPSPRRPPGRT